MQEFDLGDYESARSLANSIKTNAGNIDEIFNKMNDVMVKLSEDWKGEGSRQVQEMYSEIKSQYPVFYNRMISDTDYILSVTAKDEEAEEAAKATVENAGV